MRPAFSLRRASSPGFRANLTFIDLTDPSWRPLNSAVRQLVYSETGRAVLHVMVQGNLVVSDRRMISIDENKLCEEAERLRGAIAEELAHKMNPDRNLTTAYKAMLSEVEIAPLAINPLFLRSSC